MDYLSLIGQAAGGQGHSAGVAASSIVNPTGYDDLKIATDSTDDQIKKLADDLNVRLDTSTKDALVQYYLNEQSADRGYQRSIKYNEEMYPALVEGLRKAGLNPFLALSSLSGGSLQNGASNSGGKAAEISMNKRDAGANVAKTLMMVLSGIAAAVIYAL